MRLLGRSRELGRIRAFLDGREPNLVLVSGIRGGGKSSLVRHAMADYGGLVHVCPPLPDPAQRAALVRRIRALATDPTRGVEGAGGTPSPPDELPGDADWRTVLDVVYSNVDTDGRPFVLVLDDAHRLAEARSRFLDPLRDVLARAASEGVPFHAVLVGPRASLPVDRASPERGADGVAVEHLSVGPLSFRAAAELLPGRGPEGRVRAYGVFGGVPSILALLNRSVTVGTNVRRLLLAPDGPLADAGAMWLERDIQAPARYYAIMRTLARGEADWSAVHEGVADLTRSGQVAPYLKRLAELGLVQARRSVDAAPRGRARRYAVTDPFFAFWFRFLLPYRAAVPGATAAGEEHYARAIRPRIDDHMRGVFPLVCRQHMAHDAIETLGSVAREGGSLWGPGYDLPVAGMLTSGAAYFGACRWAGEDTERSPLAVIEESMRETRYGFGRENRLRLVFTGRAPPMHLRRELVRHDDARLIDAEDLCG